MNKIDILYEVYYKNFGEKEAVALYDDAFNKFHENKLNIHAEEYLMLSIIERTAIVLYHIPFTIVAQWRYEGWPKICFICNKQLNIEQGGWRALKKLNRGGRILENVIIHWDCNTACDEEFS